MGRSGRRAHESACRPKAVPDGPDRAAARQHVDQFIEVPFPRQVQPRSGLYCGVRQRDRGVGGPWSVPAVDLAGDDAQQRATVLRLDQLDGTTFDGLILRRRELVLPGRFTHSWMPRNRPPLSTSSAGGVSMCRMPAPAVVHWVAPSAIRPPPPCESWWAKRPSSMWVTVSKPRCGCQSVPRGSPGWYSTSPIWSMWTNRPRSAALTPANTRTTGKPSPSNPRGPVVTERTGRSVSDGIGAVRRGQVRYRR
jgi:hypothetical protein